jgi:hypothetical protein
MGLTMNALINAPLLLEECKSYMSMTVGIDARTVCFWIA